MWKLALVSNIFSSRIKRETDSNKYVFHPTYVVVSQGVILLCEKDVHSIAVKTANNHIQAVAEHLQIPLKLWKVQLPSCSSSLWRDWLQWIITKAIKSHNYLAMSILGRLVIYRRKSKLHFCTGNKKRLINCCTPVTTPVVFQSLCRVFSVLLFFYFMELLVFLPQ